MSRYRRRFLKFLWLLLVVALVVGVWQLSSLFRINNFDVRATVQAPQTGITQVVTEDGGSSVSTVNKTGSTNGTAPFTGNAGLGNVPQDTAPADTTSPNNGGNSEPTMVQISGQGNLIYINTPIDYGTVFPGEEITDYFTVHLNVTENVTYTVNITANITGGFWDMRPYLMVEKIPSVSDTDTEPDPTAGIADGINLDYIATGNLTPISDIWDKWRVTFYVPILLGDYQADIYVEPEAKTTVD
jgi:hypothetical protein